MGLQKPERQHGLFGVSHYGYRAIPCEKEVTLRWLEFAVLGLDFEKHIAICDSDEEIGAAVAEWSER